MEKTEGLSPRMTVDEFKKLSEGDQEWVSCLCMRLCGHFLSCNAPKCPLDPRIDLRPKLFGEDKCDLSKNKRLKLATGLPLPYQGMTKREFAGYTKWQDMSEEDKNKIIKQIKK